MQDNLQTGLQDNWPDHLENVTHLSARCPSFVGEPLCKHAVVFLRIGVAGCAGSGLSDPRLASLCGRALVFGACRRADRSCWSFPKGSVAMYDQRRLALGLAEEGSDLLPGKAGF